MLRRWIWLWRGRKCSGAGSEGLAVEYQRFQCLLCSKDTMFGHSQGWRLWTRVRTCTNIRREGCGQGMFLRSVSSCCPPPTSTSSSSHDSFSVCLSASVCWRLREFERDKFANYLYSIHSPRYLPIQVCSLPLTLLPHISRCFSDKVINCRLCLRTRNWLLGSGRDICRTRRSVFFITD